MRFSIFIRHIRGRVIVGMFSFSFRYLFIFQYFLTFMKMLFFLEFSFYGMEGTLVFLNDSLLVSIEHLFVDSIFLSIFLQHFVLILNTIGCKKDSYYKSFTQSFLLTQWGRSAITHCRGRFHSLRSQFDQ